MYIGYSVGKSTQQFYGNDTAICCNCKHYIQHYSRVSKECFLEVHTGHCVKPRGHLQRGRRSSAGPRDPTGKA